MTGPSGEPVGAITCRFDAANCYKAAANVCPTGYDIVGGSIDSGTILVRCRAPVAYAPR